MSERIDFGLNFGIDIDKLQKLSSELTELKNTLSSIMNTSNKSINESMIKDIEKVEQRYNKFLSTFAKGGNSHVSLLEPTLNDLKKLQTEINKTFQNSPAVQEYKQLSTLIDQNSNKLKQFRDVQLSLKDSKGSFMSMSSAIKEADELKQKLNQLKTSQMDLSNSTSKKPIEIDTKKYQEILQIKQRIKDIQSSTPVDSGFKESYKNFATLKKEVDNYEKVLARLGKRATNFVNTDKDVQQYRNLEQSIRKVKDEQSKLISNNNVSKNMDTNSTSVNNLTKEYIKLMNSMTNTRNNLKSVSDVFKGNSLQGITSQANSYKNMTNYSQQLIDLELKRQKIVESISKTNRENLNYISRMANMTPKDFAKQMSGGLQSQKVIVKDVMSNISSSPFINSKLTAQLKAMNIMSNMTSEPDIKILTDSIARSTQTKLFNSRVTTDIDKLKSYMNSLGNSNNLGKVDRLGNTLQNRISFYSSRNKPEVANAYKSLWSDIETLTKKVEGNIANIEQGHKDAYKSATQYKNIMASYRANHKDPETMVNTRESLRDLLDKSKGIDPSKRWMIEKSYNRLDNSIKNTVTPMVQESQNSNQNVMGFFRNLTNLYIGYQTFSRMVNVQDLYNFERQSASFAVASEQTDPRYQGAIKNKLLNYTNNKPIETNEFVNDITEVVKTGRSYNEAMTLVSGSTDIAIANFSDLSTAVDLVNNQLLALELDVTSDRIKRMSDRMHSALVNTALDVEDVSNAGRQGNTILNALVNMGAENGVGSSIRKYKDVDDYAEQLGNLNLAFIGSLRQKGKTGAQGGTIERNTFTKLLQLDNTGAKRLDSDLMKANPDLLKEIGFGSSKEMMQMAKSDMQSVLEGLSKLQDKGVLSFSTISKMFTERHASSISSVLSDINGNLDKFIDKITTGKDASKDAGFAMTNWANQLKSLGNNFGNFKKSLLSTGVLPATAGLILSGANKGLGTINNVMTSENPIISTLGQVGSQTVTTALGYQAFSSFIKQQARNKVMGSFSTALSNARDEATTKALQRGMDVASLKFNANSFSLKDNIQLATSNSNLLAKNLGVVEGSLEKASKSSGMFAEGLMGAGVNMGKLLGGLGVLVAINLAIVGITKMMEITSKNNALSDKLQKDIELSYEFSNRLHDLSVDINKAYETPKELEDSYSNMISSYISKNQELLESLQLVKTTKEQTFKTVTEISNDYFKAKYGKYEYENPEQKQSRTLKDISTEYGLGRETGLFAGVMGNKKEFSTETIFLEKHLNKEGRDLVNKTRKAIVDNYIKGATSTNEGGVLSKDSLNLNNVYLGKELTLNGRNVEKLQKQISKRFQDNADSVKKKTEKLKLDSKQTTEYNVSNLFEGLSSDDLNMVFQNKNQVGIGKNDSSREKISKIIEASTSVDKNGAKSYDFNFIYSQIDKMGVSVDLRQQYIQAIQEVANDYQAIDEAYLKQMTALIDVRDNAIQTLNNLRSNNRASILTKLGMSYNFDMDKDSFEGNGRVFNLNAIRDEANKTLKNEINTSPMLNTDLDTTIAYQSQLKANIQQTFQLREKQKLAQDKLNNDRLKMKASDIKEMETQLAFLKDSIDANEKAKAEIQKAFQLSIYNNATREQLQDLQKQNMVSSLNYRYQAGISFGDKGSELQSRYKSYVYDRNVFDAYGRDNLKAQIIEGNNSMTEAQSNFMGINNYNKVDVNTALNMQKLLLDAKSKNLSQVTNNGQTISLADAEEIALKMSSISAEQMSVRQRELELLQQRKAIEIEIVKAELERNKKHTTYIQSVDILSNEYAQQSLLGNRYLTGNTSTRMEDKGDLLVLKLAGQEAKLNDQLAQTKHSIKISIENAMKQVEAIKKLDNQVYKSSDRIISQIPNKLAPYLDKIDASIQSMGMSNGEGLYSIFDENTSSNTDNQSVASVNNIVQIATSGALNPTTATPKSDMSIEDAMAMILPNKPAIKSIVNAVKNSGYRSTIKVDPNVMDMISMGETSHKARTVEALGNVSEDTDGTNSYGFMGMNTGGSMDKFIKMYARQLGLPTDPKTYKGRNASGIQAFKKAVKNNPNAMYNAQTEYLYKYYIPDRVGVDLDNFMKKYVHPNIQTNEGVRAAITDTIVQQGVAGSIGAIKKGEFKNISNPKEFLNKQIKYEWDNLGYTFHKAIEQQVYSPEGHKTRMDKRYKYAFSKIGEKYNPDAYKHVNNNETPSTYNALAEEITLDDNQKSLVNRINKMTGMDYTASLRKDANTLQKLTEKFNEYIEGKNLNKGKETLESIISKLKEEALSYKAEDGDFEVIKDVMGQLYSTLTQQLSDLRENLIEQKKEFLDTVNSFAYSNNEMATQINQLEKKKIDLYKVVSENEFTSWSNEYQARLQKIKDTQVDRDTKAYLKSMLDTGSNEAMVRAIGLDSLSTFVQTKDGGFSKVNTLMTDESMDGNAMQEYKAFLTSTTDKPILDYNKLSSLQLNKLYEAQAVKYRTETDLGTMYKTIKKLTDKFINLTSSEVLQKADFFQIGNLTNLNKDEQAKTLDAFLQRLNTDLQDPNSNTSKVYKENNILLDELITTANTLKELQEQFDRQKQIEDEKLALEKEYIDHMRKVIPMMSNMYYDINKIDNSKSREYNQNMTSYVMTSNGVNLDSNYAKSILARVKLDNASNLIKENVANFNTRLNTLGVKNLYSSQGYDVDSYKLRGNDTVNMVRNYEILNKMRETNKSKAREEFNNLYSSLQTPDTLELFKGANITTDEGISKLLNTIGMANLEGKDESFRGNIANLISKGTELLQGNPELDNTLNQLIDMIKQNTDALQDSMSMYSEAYKTGIGMVSDILFSKDMKQLDPSQSFNNLFGSTVFTTMFTSFIKKKDIQNAIGEDVWKKEGIKVNLHNQIVNKKNEVLDPITLQPIMTGKKDKNGNPLAEKGKFLSANEIANLSLNGLVVFDGLMKQMRDNKLEELKIQEQILQMNLQMAKTTEERRQIESDILRNKISQIDTDYRQKSSFMGISGTTGFGLQGALGGAMQGSAFGPVGTIVGGALGLFGGMKSGLNAKAQASQEQAMLVAQQKMTWLAEDSNRYLKTMSEAMSEQAKWTTKVGVNDAISRSISFAMGKGVDTIGGTAYEDRQVSKKAKKMGGLAKKKWSEVETFTASYNLNDAMFGGRQFNNKQDLEFALSTVGQNLINNPLLTSYTKGKGLKGFLNRTRPIDRNRITEASDYLNYRAFESTRELNSNQFLQAFNQTNTLGGMGMLIDQSGQSKVDSVLRDLEGRLGNVDIQDRVNVKAMIDFYNNIKTVLDREGKTTKRLFGNYYGIDTEEVKDEKGNITEYKRVNESMWSDYYQQMVKNSLDGGKSFSTGSTFVQGTLSAFVQNVSSGRNSVKAITEQFSKLADEIYDVVTRTGEFTNVNGTISNMVNNLKALTEQQKEVDRFTVDLAKKWVGVGGNITDVLAGMNNGLGLALSGIKENLLGKSLEDNINSFGTSLFGRLSESLTTNLINKKYSNQIFDVNERLTTAMDTNSVSDIVALGSMYKGVSAKAEADRQRIEALSRLFSANRNIDYMDEGIKYETGTSQSVNYNISNQTDVNVGTLIGDELSLDLFVSKLSPMLYQQWKDLGLIK